MHTISGHYMFVEASDGLPGHMTYLWFPPLETSQNSSLQFKYHMYGDQIGKLSVLAVDSTGSLSELWSKTGSQWQYWHKVTTIYFLSLSLSQLKFKY